VNRRRFRADELTPFAEAVVSQLGADARAAHVVAQNLVEADRRGVHTHGLVRLPSYADDVRAGRIVADAVPMVERDGGAVATVDGRAAFGAMTGVIAIDEAVDRASRHGVGVVAARGGNHFGAAAYYSLRAADRGFVGIVATSTPAVMAPWGGAEARLGNNPLSIAAPVADGMAPFVVDLALSAVSRGRIKLAELSGEQIPESWALDRDGRPTSDAAAALAGALLPIGSYKGYGLALAIEVLTGVLAGGDLGPELINASLTGTASSGSATRVGTTGSLYVAIDPERFVGRDAFRERLARLVELIGGTPPAEGFDEVLVPGEIEARAAAEADRLGIPLDAATVDALSRLAVEMSLGFPAGVD
jgi:LDH2 family malate/lactate/ureidoglycolate dehydrogenase